MRNTFQRLSQHKQLFSVRLQERSKTNKKKKKKSEKYDKDNIQQLTEQPKKKKAVKRHNEACRGLWGEQSLPTNDRRSPSQCAKSPALPACLTAWLGTVACVTKTPQRVVLRVSVASTLPTLTLGET